MLRGRNELMLRPLTLVGLLVALGTAGGLTAYLSNLGTAWPGWLIGAVAAVAGAIGGLVLRPLIKTWVETRTKRVINAEDNRQSITQTVIHIAGTPDLPLVSMITERSPLGIHPAIPLPKNAPEGLMPELPEYVPRDKDAEVHAVLTRMRSTGGFLLLVGPPAAGKSRCAATAMQQLLGPWRLYLRAGTRSLPELLDTGISLARTVIWLDDIHELLYDSVSQAQDSNKLTADIMRRLLMPGTGPVIVIGTTWPEIRDRFSARPEVVGDGPDPWKDARSIINMATQIDLRLNFTDQEWERAQSLASTDPRIAEATRLGHRRALGATLASKDELINRWKNGGNPYGAAVISAVIQARRCGHPQPVGKMLIQTLAEASLSAAQRSTADPHAWLNSALMWACQPVRGDISALTPEGERVGRVDGYSVTDMLLDYASNGPDIEAVPDAVWAVVVNDAPVGALISISDAAADAGKFRMLDMALRRASAAGDETALVVLAMMLAVRGGNEEDDLYLGAVDSLGASDLRNVATILFQYDQPRKAQAICQRLLDTGEYFELAIIALTLVDQAGHGALAVDLCRQLIEKGQYKLVENIVGVLADRDNPNDAIELLCQLLVDTGHVVGVFSVAVKLYQRFGGTERVEALRSYMTAGGFADRANAVPVVAAQEIQ